MAAALSPPFLLLAVLLLTTAGTIQCHGHNRHHHQTDGTRRPNKAAAADARPPADTADHAICQKTPHPVSCLVAVASHLNAVAGASAKEAEASAVSVQLLPPNVLSVVVASLRGATSALSLWSWERLCAPRDACMNCMGMRGVRKSDMSDDVTKQQPQPTSSATLWCTTSLGRTTWNARHSLTGHGNAKTFSARLWAGQRQGWPLGHAALQFLERQNEKMGRTLTREGAEHANWRLERSKAIRSASQRLIRWSARRVFSDVGIHKVLRALGSHMSELH
ncbi:putative pectin methylesterase [Panicum miliaceum]|uniref:Pectin methylesterase n=1 Tax=Panicum miliaceum TaxID=4540 RepID=A0A3L6RYZ8_PANMI|nr:putative pectin methylesterase [Panicum miliaceum]